MVKSCNNCGYRKGSISFGTCLLSGHDATIERQIPTKCGEQFQNWVQRESVWYKIKAYFSEDK